MKRKIVKQGPSTLMISLPSSWTKKYNLNKGDVIDIEDTERFLKITTDNSIKTNPIEINGKGLDFAHIKEHIDEAYKAGYDELKVMLSDKDIINKLQKYITKVLMGYEIVEATGQNLMIKSISNNDGKEFDSILRRIFRVTNELANRSLELLKNRDFKSAEDILVLEETNDKLTNFCERLLTKQGYKTYHKTSFVYLLVWQLEKIADEHNYICRFLIKNKNMKASDEIIELYEEVNDLFLSFYHMFYDHSKKRLLEYSSKCEMLIKKSVMIDSASKGKQLYVTTHLIVLITLILNLRGPYIGYKI